MAKILVVEDELELRESIVEELAEEGHVTVEAANGREGLATMLAEKPDLILSDITMPQMNGYQFFRAVRENYLEEAGIPFIFLTALADRDDELKGLRLGVDDYITKPVDFDLLLARVELCLRRHRRTDRQAAPQMPVVEPPETRREAAGGELEDFLAGQEGLIQTGKFETISLEAIKKKVGDRWAEMSSRILEHARAAIDEHLGPRDVCRVTASEDFVVCFAELVDEQVDAKVRRMGDAIWDRLFGVTEDEDLSHVDAQAFEISLKPDAMRDGDATFAEIEALIDQEKAVTSQGSLKNLQQIYDYEDLFALTLFNAKGTSSTIKMLAFEDRHVERVRKLFHAHHYDAAFLLDLQQRLFARLKERPKLSRTFRQSLMLVSVHFTLIQDPAARIGFKALCDDLKSSIGIDLIIEYVETPNRFKAHGSALETVPLGRIPQFLEIRRTAQLDGLQIGDLPKLNMPFISMRYQDVICHDKTQLQQCLSLLEKGGTKLCIKDIPKGKLLDVQMIMAHLYTLKK